MSNLRVNLEDLAPASEGGVLVARVPLPPGARLAAAVHGVRQLQGALYVTYAAHEADITVPMRFELAGTFTVREATAKSQERGVAWAVARARPITIGP